MYQLNNAAEYLIMTAARRRINWLLPTTDRALPSRSFFMLQ